MYSDHRRRKGSDHREPRPARKGGSIVGDLLLACLALGFVYLVGTLLIVGLRYLGIELF